MTDPNLSYLFVAALSGVLLSVVLLVGAGAFYRLAESSVSLLDAFLDPDLDEDSRHARVSGRLGPTLLGLLLFGIYLVAMVGAALLPLFAYARLTDRPFDALDTSSGWFWLALGIGSVVPFVVKSLLDRGRTDYSPISKVLHRLLLNNYSLSRKLFYRESGRLVASETIAERFVIVTGLARAGTTALTKALAERGPFASLRYRDMPLLMSPRLWRRLHRPQRQQLRERSHGDAVLFGVESVEALEEYFFKNMLRDAYVEPDRLREHSISAELHQEYLRYQTLVRGQDDEAIYLAKNNNFLLRYASLREQNRAFAVLCLFRDPLEQAHSLLKQHRRFSKLQAEDPFVLEYMDWLGHHEFGLNQKPFAFEGQPALPDYDRNGIDFWLASWLRYYQRVLALPDRHRFYLVQYADFEQHPVPTLDRIARTLQLPLRTDDLRAFDNPNRYTGPAPDAELLAACRRVFERLGAEKIS